MTNLTPGVAMATEPVRIQESIRFGDDFELDLCAYKLSRCGRVLKLERIPLEVLQLLVERRRQIVTREQIVERIWGNGVFLDTDNSINGAIRKIRQALKDDPEHPRFVQTITGRGYRFIAPVGETTKIEPKLLETEKTNEPAGRSSQLPAALLATRPTHWHWPIPLGLAVLVIVAVGTWVQWSRSSIRSQSSGTRIMLAVLPFENLTGDPAQEYFSDGLTEEMISQLGSLDPQHLGIIARTSVMHYKSSPAPLSQIGRELGVQYVLEGSVRRDSNRVRITAQLVQIKDQAHAWTRQYDRELRGLLALQREIAQEIGDGIQRTLGDQYKMNAARTLPRMAATTSYEAYDLYLKGRYFWNKRTPAGFQQASDYFQQAIAKDSNYARAYAGLADTYALMSTWSLVPQNEFMPKARTAALRALQIDESLPEAHASLALIAENFDYDWQVAEKEFQRAVQLDPGYAPAHQWYAEYLSWRGRFDEALIESERARRLDPMSLIIATDHGAVLYFARQYGRAIEQLRAVLEMEPNFSRSRCLIISAYVQESRFDEALAELRQWRRIDNNPGTWAEEAYIYGRWGRREQARLALGKFKQLVRNSQSDPMPWLLLANLGMDRKDEAIAVLQDAYSKHSNAVVGLKVDPNYDSLRTDARFQALFLRVGLAQ